jgi:hypothetical protein
VQTLSSNSSVAKNKENKTKQRHHMTLQYNSIYFRDQLVPMAYKLLKEENKNAYIFTKQV